MSDADVARLRREAHERAVKRPRRPFGGEVVDEVRAGVAMRWYTPPSPERTTGLVFLHGGFGLFGDLDLQDGYCRQVAETLGVVVASVDYRLTPEASLDDAVADALAGVEALAALGVTRILLGGDSAGGAVARIAAERSPRPLAGLLLTNPNLDLTLATYDDALPGGPGRELSAFAFRAWARVSDLATAPRLDVSAVGLPPTLLAVGSLDSLLPEAQAFAAACERDGVDCRLVVLDGAAHGFVGTERAGEVLAAAAEFFRRTYRVLSAPEG
jgi:acetyl esterase